MMKINIDWLRRESTPTSYERGGHYYDNVNHLTKIGDHYQAQVSGSEFYQVTIEESNIDVNGYCSCPYSGIGICKHIIAVGLNVIDGKFHEEKIIDNEVEFSLVNTTNLANIPKSSEAPDDFYESTFLNTPELQRTAFLKQLFQQNSDLQKQFTHFTQVIDQPSFSKNITQIRTVLQQGIKHLKFKMPDEEYYDYDDFDELVEKNTDRYAEIFAPFGEKMLKYIRQGVISKALQILGAMSEATFDIKNLEWANYLHYDEYIVDFDFPFNEWERLAAKTIQEVILSTAALEATIDHFFKLRATFASSNNTEDTNAYSPEKFQHFLIALTQQEPTALYLLEQLEKGNFYHHANVNLYIHLSKTSKQEAFWIQISEDFAGNYPSIAEALLDFYHDKNMKEDFYRLAQQTFAVFPKKSVVHLLGKVKPKEERKFFIELLTYYTQEKNSIQAYRRLREYLNETQRQYFIQQNYHDATFYTQLLEVEQRYGDILEYAQTHKQDWNFTQIISPILNIFPQESFDMLTERAFLQMSSQSRNRKLYQRVIRNLSPILKIKTHQEETQEYAKRLKKTFNHLPAFLDEMKKGGF